MKSFCTNCLTNWASLHSQDEGDETYEYCPLCRTDTFLEDARPGDTYMMQIDGKVINVTTREQRKEHVKPCTTTSPAPFNWDNWKKQKAEHERQEEADLCAYIGLYEQGKLEQAEQHFYELRSKHV